MWLYFIEIIMPFPLGVYSIGKYALGHISNYALGLRLNIEHSFKSYVLFSVSHQLYLEASTERCCLKYVL